MLEFRNVRVSNLKEAVTASKNAFRLEPPVYSTEEEFEADFQDSLARARKLAKAGGGTGHSSFRKGINVSFVMKYTQYITKQFQRYEHFVYVSSTSMMHKIISMDFSKCVNKYVTKESIEQEKRLIAQYKYIVENKCSHWVFTETPEPIVAESFEDAVYEAYMLVISNCPMGAELYVEVNTNYEQLATIAKQRWSHKLREDYKAFFDMVKNLPYAEDLIPEAFKNEKHD